MKLAKRLMMRQYGIETDPSWENVSLCINTHTGVQNATNIVDATGKTISVYGNTKFDATYEHMAVSFDGSADYLTLPDSSDFNFGAGDFTIEAVVRLGLAKAEGSRIWNANGDYATGVDITLWRDASNGNAPVGVYMSSNGSSWNLVSFASNSWALVPGVWTYLAVSRQGGTVKLALNSSICTITTGLGTSSVHHRGLGRSIGGQAGTSRPLYGHIRGYRVTKGVARDLSVIPTLPFPTS